jgi:hypothetical protein
VRAESSAVDITAAFDLALEKLHERLRRNRDRLKDRRSAHVAKLHDKQAEGAGFDPASLEEELKSSARDAKKMAQNIAATLDSKLAVGETLIAHLEDSPVEIRRKVHEGERLSVDEALERMELLGHDFYLFIHESTGRPSVIYRRHGWSYGVIEIN